MSGFEIDPDVLTAYARRREDDAWTVRGIGEQIASVSDDGLALGVLCSWVRRDVRDSLEAVDDLVRKLSDSARVLADALHDSARDHRETDEAMASDFEELM